MIPVREPRSKRPRDIDYPSFTVNDILRKLHQSLTSQQRRSITAEVLVDLKSQRKNATFFDSLLHAGVHTSLCLHLGFIFNREAESKEEIENIMCILSCIYKNCNVEVRNKSVSEIGPDLFKLLLKGMACGIVLPVLTILHICSSNMQGTSMLLKCRVIHFVADVMQVQNNLQNEVILEMLGLLKNLSYFGEERRHEIADHNVLISHLAQFVCTSGANENEKSLERISAIFRNLAVSPSTRPLMVQNNNTLSASVRLGSTTNRQIHRNILSFLLCLSQEMDSCMILCLHGDGLILNMLKRLMSVETDSITRKRAVRVLRMLACDTSGPLLIHDPALLSSLAQRALQDISNEVRTEAADALARLAAFIKYPMPQHQTILDALTQLCQSPTAQPEVLAQALMKQAAQPPNRLPMVERRMLIESLAQIAMSLETTKAAKEHACCAILDLTKEESNRERIATCSILEALVLNSSDFHETDQYQCHIYALNALINLAASYDNRKAMTTHRRLLQTLVQYAASSTDEDLKKDVKMTILALALEL